MFQFNSVELHKFSEMIINPRSYEWVTADVGRIIAAPEERAKAESQAKLVWLGTGATLGAAEIWTQANLCKMIVWLTAWPPQLLTAFLVKGILNNPRANLKSMYWKERLKL